MDRPSLVPGIVLAAGASSRMGRSKALLPIGSQGETFVSRIVSTLREAGTDDVLVVAGPDAADVARVLEALPVPPRIVQNLQADRGQLASLLVGLQILDRPGVHAVLIMPVDLPLVSVATVKAVLDAYRRTGAPIVRPSKAGRHGHPVIFDRALFSELRRASLDEGARAVVGAHRTQVVDVPVDEDGPFTDIDTPDDYDRLIARSC